MGYSSVKREFIQWVISLNKSGLSDIDKKLLNLLINSFDEIIPLGTNSGMRAKKIGQLIEKNKHTISSDINEIDNQNTRDIEIFKSIAELKIGPFRGFTREETFVFDRKYTFMYGPNGSGKSSFCEGLEYALLGSIEEADSKRIDVSVYTKNARVGTAISPKVFGISSNKQKTIIPQNSNAYRFCFIEKNRIDGFARIAANTAKNQQDRIATLFGLDDFNEFVNNFTENFNEKYLTLVNQKEIDFNLESQKIELSKNRITEIIEVLKKQDIDVATLINEVAKEEIKTIDELKLYLIGEDGTKGIINSLQEKKAEIVPDNKDESFFESLKKCLLLQQTNMTNLNSYIAELNKYSSEVSYKDLYIAIDSIAKNASNTLSICPACKTPIDRVVINPFSNAVSELSKLGYLTKLQQEIEKTAILMGKEIRKANSFVKNLNEIKDLISNKETKFSMFTEFEYTGISSISEWKSMFTNEIHQVEKEINGNIQLLNDIKTYNIVLQNRRDEKEKIEKDLLKNQNFKQRLDEFIAQKVTLNKEKAELQGSISNFEMKNEEKINEINEIKKEIDLNKEYVKSYNLLIGKLKEYRDALPSKLAAGLSDRARDFYNIINEHDPEFEKIERLKLPTAAGEKIIIQFHGDTRIHDALCILSEGHIKILGLSLLLSKVISEDLGFIIYDDIVNAIDDEHRDGIAELLLRNSDLKDRQHIITCHGEIFITKLEHKLGVSTADREVKGYRFVPQENIGERGIKISIGNTKHYLLLAKKSLAEDDRKDVASRCRQAIESISEQLWNKLGRKLNINLTVKMRSPGSRPDLSSVVDALIKELQAISGSGELQTKLKELKEKYPWNLLNKGTHEQGDLPELERKDVADLLKLVEEIEVKASEVKLEVKSA